MDQTRTGDRVAETTAGRIDLVSEQFRRDLHELKDALVNAAATRDQRDQFDTATGELVANTGIVPTEYGFRIRTAETYSVEVHRALFNWRLVLHVHGIECSPPSAEHPHGMCPTLEHGYCYFGLERLARAVAAGLEWQDPLRTDPAGFDRKAF